MRRGKHLSMPTYPFSAISDNSSNACLCVFQFGAADALKGHVPVALLVLKNDTARPEEEVCAVVSLRERSGYAHPVIILYPPTSLILIPADQTPSCHGREE